MISFKTVIFLLKFFEVYIQIKGLEELLKLDDNTVASTVAATSNVTKQLFITLGLGSEEKTNIKHVSTVRDYLNSITSKNYKNLNKITKLTKVTRKPDGTLDIFITAFDGVHNESDNIFEIEENNDTLHAYDVVNYIKDITTQLKKIKNNNENIRLANISQKPETKRADIFSEFKFKNSTYLADKGNIYSNYWNDAENIERRIFSGKRTRVKHFPFMAVVLIFNQFQCAGSIIKSDLVITAASCLQLAWNNRFYRENPAFLTVRIGTQFFDGGGETIPVLEVYFHPDYDPKSLRHNLGIMRLIRRIKFRKKKKRVKKIDFDKDPTPLSENVNGITIVGWGPTGSSNKIVSSWRNALSFAVLDVYGLPECQDIYGKQYVTKRHFCAGFISHGGGACNRDVGGPGIVDGKLVGVISFGSPICGARDSPTVFTKVGYYADWIEHIMDQDVPFSRKRTSLKTTEETTASVKETTVPVITTIRLSPIVRTTGTNKYTTTSELTIKLPDNPLFKQFLKTLLNSEEIEEYHDMIYKNDVSGEAQVNKLGVQEQPKIKMQMKDKVIDSYTEPTTFTVLYRYKDNHKEFHPDYFNNDDDGEKNNDSDVARLIDEYDSIEHEEISKDSSDFDEKLKKGDVSSDIPNEETTNISVFDKYRSHPNADKKLLRMTNNPVIQIDVILTENPIPSESKNDLAQVSISNSDNRDNSDNLPNIIDSQFEEMYRLLSKKEVFDLLNEVVEEQLRNQTINWY